MIKDFIKETEKNFGRESTPAEKEVFQLANEIYDTLQKGTVRKQTRKIVVKLIESISPDLTDIEKIEASICIESLIISFLCEFLSVGTIISVKVKK